MAIKHAFVSTKGQGGDASLVSKNEWNADHAVSGESPFSSVYDYYEYVTAVSVPSGTVTLISRTVTLAAGVYRASGRVVPVAGAGNSNIHWNVSGGGTLIYGSIGDSRTQTYAPHHLDALISHDGGSLTVAIDCTYESGTVSFGATGDNRFASYIILTRIGS